LYSGHGLGLHIAQSYVSLLGGEIRLTTSEEGVGSIFRFNLQCKKAAEKKFKPVLLRVAEAEAPPYRQITTTPHLLLVEDNIIALKVLESIVNNAGYQFTSARCGKEAWDLLIAAPFDMIITDIGLPDISGIELTRRIRTWEQKQNKKPLPILGLTGHATDMAQSESLAVGMNDVYSKPVNLALIQEMVNRFVIIKS
jgi:two-component system aerobic respiration control sensor histidine kinase ArcB